jgi:PAS domain S-box-containing protein
MMIKPGYEELEKKARILEALLSDLPLQDHILSCLQNAEELIKANPELKSTLLEQITRLFEMNVKLKQEILEHERVERDLKYKANRLESLIEHSLLAIVTLDAENKVVSCNEFFEKIFQYQQAEILGKDLDELLAGELYLQDAKANTEKVRRGQTIHRMGKRRRKDGSFIDAEIFGVPVIVDEKVMGLYFIYSDISERKRMEEALRESEEKYRSILESMEEGYYEVDLKGSFTFINKALCRVFGYSEEELIGLNNRQFMDEYNAEKVYQAFNKVYENGIPLKGLRLEIFEKEGNRRTVEISIALIREVKGHSIGFRGIVQDISEKKSIEAQLLQIQKLEALGTLAGGIAHNFNNLLMGILGNTSLMLLELDPENPNCKRLKTIESLIQNGSKLTSQLLGYAREGKYAPQALAVNPIVKETAQTFAMTRKEISIHYDLTEDLLPVVADKSQMEQVLLNLFINAADAMPQGGQLYLHTQNVTHAEIYGIPFDPKKGSYILLSVRDTGIGMDQKTIERIFEPFYTTKGLSRGTGLSLASCYGIIKAHQGYIRVESQKGAGTTFYIYLPAVTDSAFLSAQSKFPEAVKEGKTLLLIDDEAPILDVGRQMLEKLGYRVFTAQNGEEALGLYQSHYKQIDAVILDMIMPGKSGSETFDQMLVINPHSKVLLASGYSIDGQAGKIMERGCKGFIQKPFDLEELSKKINEILG